MKTFPTVSERELILVEALEEIADVSSALSKKRDQSYADWELRHIARKALEMFRNMGSYTSPKESEIYEKQNPSRTESTTLRGNQSGSFEGLYRRYPERNIDSQEHLGTTPSDSNLQTEGVTVKPREAGRNHLMVDKQLWSQLHERIAELGMEVNRLTFELELSRESHVKRIAQLEAENAKLREALKESEG